MNTPINEAMSEMGQTSNVKVGDGVTGYGWSDRYAYFVTKIISPCKIEVQRAKCTRKPGTTYYDQEYIIEPNPDGHKKILIKTANMKAWREWKVRSSITYSIGCACEYRDPSF